MKRKESLEKMYGEGLGQTDDEITSARDILLRQITRLDAELARFPESYTVQQARGELGKAKQWYAAALETFYTFADNAKAMDNIATGMRRAHSAAKIIQRLDPQNQVAQQAEAETAKGASFTYQVERTIKEAVSKPVAAALERFSPVAAAAVRSNWWLVPVAGAGLAFLLLRR